MGFQKHFLSQLNSPSSTRLRNRFGGRGFGSDIFSSIVRTIDMKGSFGCLCGLRQCQKQSMGQHVRQKALLEM